MTGSDSQHERHDSRDASQSGDRAAGQHSVAERVTLAVGIVVILVLIGLVTYVSFSGGDELPVIAATPVLAEMREEGTLYYVPVTVTNDGQRTAEDVIVRAELANGETAEFTLDFLAGDETREGTVVFATQPTAESLSVRVASFR
jgi:uncharacterized protein (TIGR02588 family)